MWVDSRPEDDWKRKGKLICGQVDSITWLHKALVSQGFIIVFIFKHKHKG